MMRLMLTLLVALMLLGQPALAARADFAPSRAVTYPPVRPDTRLEFPRDHGSHPDYRTEWWYLTGWLEEPGGGPLGFQVTFFRSRPPRESANPSAFNPRQLIFAHAALADPALGRLRHAERSARAGLGLAGAEAGNTRVWIDDWHLSLGADGRYRAHVAAKGWGLDLELAPTQSLLLQGQGGYSRKGPGAQEASHYYSRPQLRVSGTLRRDGRAVGVRGSAWLDHEWSTTILNPAAAGWDWTGVNLNDGGALMAFRIRDKTGGSLWAGGTRRDAAGGVRVFSPAEVSWRPLRQWRSPRTGVVYPVAWRLAVPGLAVELRPLLDDQELDGRGSTGTLYWEGAVRALAPGGAAGAEIGRGYLELTGYGGELDL